MIYITVLLLFSVWPQKSHINKQWKIIPRKCLDQIWYDWWLKLSLQIKNYQWVSLISDVLCQLVEPYMKITEWRAKCQSLCVVEISRNKYNVLLQTSQLSGSKFSKALAEYGEEIWVVETTYQNNHNRFLKSNERIIKTVWYSLSKFLSLLFLHTCILDKESDG